MESYQFLVPCSHPPLNRRVFVAGHVTKAGTLRGSIPHSVLCVANPRQRAHARARLLIRERRNTARPCAILRSAFGPCPKRNLSVQVRGMYGRMEDRVAKMEEQGREKERRCGKLFNDRFRTLFAKESALGCDIAC